jgi:uncharacterized protein (TIGR03435 family)
MGAKGIVGVNLHKLLVSFAVGLLTFAASNTIAQQNKNGTEQQSVSPLSPMATDAHPSFEVVTIKPADPNETNGDFIVGGHRIVIENQTVNDLIYMAYAVHQKQVVEGPAWLGTERFDIDGQADLPGVANLKQIQEMLQKLLSDRFDLKLHHDKRDLSIYAIKVAKGGPKITRSTATSSLPSQSGHGHGTQQQRKFTNNTMSDFALGMQAYMDRPVVDETNFPGRYDFTLKWTPDNSPNNEPDAVPGLFTAVQEQLGLKLEATKGPADVLVIDHIERPSAN